MTRTTLLPQNLNLGGNRFRMRRFLPVSRLTPSTWGGEPPFLDIDNDGWKDLIVANGHVYSEVDNARTGENFKQSRLLTGTGETDSSFELSSLSGPGISAEHSSRGLAIGDLDNDGDIEIVVVNMNEPPSLLKNFGPTQEVRCWCGR